MSDYLPKEKMTAYERWELASFEEGLFSSEKRTSPSQKQNSRNEQAESLEKQAAETREQARLEGYAVGLEEGRAAGFAEGRAAGIEDGRAQGMQEAAQLRQIAQSFESELQQANELVSQEILDLALGFAKAMLKSALEVRTELVLPIVRDAIHYLPSVNQPAILFLHPEDAAIVRQYMDDELNKAGWRLSEDPQIERGGCRVETASNQIDATLETRWQRLSALLGKDSDWLTP